MLLHPADLPVWQLTHAVPPDGELADGQQIPIADIALEVMHTPGHAPGAVCFYSPDLGVVFTGDTLFNGGPGATGRSLQRPRPDRGLTSPTAADLPRRDRGQDRPRRRHHHRRRAGRHSGRR